MGRKRKDFSDKCKIEVAKEALKKRAKEAEVAAKYNIAPSTLCEWMELFLEGISKVIDTGANAIKFYENTFNNENLDYSNIYLNQNLPDAKLYSWWKSAMKDLKNSSDWKQIFELEGQKQLREKLAKTL